jgi:hypothetical protein
MPGGDRIERVPDEGQWFDEGLRVEYVEPVSERRGRRLEKAVFGAYEVVACTRLHGDDQRLLAVTLRPFI